VCGLGRAEADATQVGYAVPRCCRAACCVSQGSPPLLRKLPASRPRRQEAGAPVDGSGVHDSALHLLRLVLGRVSCGQPELSTTRGLFCGDWHEARFTIENCQAGGGTQATHWHVSRSVHDLLQADCPTY
jgi:hypothetical protein